MDEVIDTLMVSVRADTQSFASDVTDMRGQLDGPFGTSIDAAGNRIESSLARSIASGKLSFKDLESAALSVLANIAASAVQLGLDSIFGGGGSSGGGGGGLLSGLTSIVGGLFGAPGRATGGPVSPNQPYMVGENGPELFVPTAAGSIAANGGGGSGARDVRVSINVNAPAGTAPDILAQSSRQVARAVRSALSQDY